MRNRSVDAVLFDLGNTLVSYYKSEEFRPILKESVAAIASVVNRHGRSIDVDKVFTRAETLNREAEDGRVWPLSERLLQVICEPAERVTEDVMSEMIDAFLEPIFATAKVDPQAIGVLEDLQTQGFKTAIVSNTPWGSPSANWRAELDRLGLLHRVNAVVFCVDVGWRKPAPQPFKRALSLLRVPSERSIFVGDDVVWDVRGARRVGVAPVLISDTGVKDEGLTVVRELADLVPLLVEPR
jgi:HAD superfamily hydrolase (TIGR01509 family)